MIRDTGVKLNQKYRESEVYVKRSGEWKQAIAYKKANGIWRSNFDADIPAGGIVPLRGIGSVPTGWSLFSSADDKHIVGAGSSYTAGSSSTGTGDITITVATDGSHSTGLVGFRGGGGSFAGPTVDPGHDHATSLLDSAAWEHQYSQYRLIQANTKTNLLPPDAIVMNHRKYSMKYMTMSQGASASGYLIRAGSARADGGNHSPTGLSLTANPIHTHAGSSGGSTGGSSGSNWKGQTPGTHTHGSSSMTLTPNLYRVLMTLWYRAASSIDINSLTNPIIMWEEERAPAGWVACDGNNGTPDLRDYFVEPTNDVSNAGDVEGDGTVAGSGTSSSAGNHDHDNNDKCGDCSKDNRMHASIVGAHTHSLTIDETWLPPYYSLTFLMKL